jgi:hypothetical protein
MTKVHEFLYMIDEGDQLGVLLLALTMLYLGKFAGRVQKRVHRSASYTAVFAAAFYVLYSLAAYGRMEPSCFLGITWRALLVAAISYGVVALSVAIATALVAPPARSTVHWIDCRLNRFANWRRDHRWRKQHAAQEQLTAERERLLAPLREQERRQAETVAHRRVQIQELKRKLRFDCQLAYNRLRPAVVEMFPQEEFSRLVDEALGAGTEPDIQRGAEALIETLRAVVGDKDQRDAASLMTIADEFDQRRAAIETSTYSAERKDDLIKYLNIQEAKEITRALEQ